MQHRHMERVSSGLGFFYMGMEGQKIVHITESGKQNRSIIEFDPIKCFAPVLLLLYSSEAAMVMLTVFFLNPSGSA